MTSPLLSIARRLLTTVCTGGVVLLATGCAMGAGSNGGPADASGSYSGKGRGVEVFGTIDAGVSNHGRSGVR